jgi:hypothetical protein
MSRRWKRRERDRDTFQVGWMDGWLDLRRERVAWLVGLVPGKVDESALARCNTMGGLSGGADGAGLGVGVGLGRKVVGKVCCTVLCKSQR